MQVTPRATRSERASTFGSESSLPTENVRLEEAGSLLPAPRLSTGLRHADEAVSSTRLSHQLRRERLQLRDGSFVRHPLDEDRIGNGPQLE